MKQVPHRVITPAVKTDLKLALCKIPCRCLVGPSRLNDRKGGSCVICEPLDRISVDTIGRYSIDMSADRSADTQLTGVSVDKSAGTRSIVSTDTRPRGSQITQDTERLSVQFNFLPQLTNENVAVINNEHLGKNFKPWQPETANA